MHLLNNTCEIKITQKDNIIINKHKSVLKSIYKSIYKEEYTNNFYNFFLSLLVESKIYNINLEEVINGIYIYMLKNPNSIVLSEKYIVETMYLFSFYEFKRAFEVKYRKKLSDYLFLFVLSYSRKMRKKIKKHIIKMINHLNTVEYEYENKEVFVW
ncbi:MAG: hypothetical protein QXF12_03440 [Candidatus Aenigmatarchaeota archaeon]